MRIKKLFGKFVDYIRETHRLNEAYYEQLDLDKKNEEIRKFREEIDRHYDGLYDFNSLEGIGKIPVKAYKYLPEPSGTPVGNIEYVLRMRAGKHWTNGNQDLSIACLYKAQQIMPLSDIAWQQKDYLRLVQDLMRAGRYDEAEAVEKAVFRFGGQKHYRESVRLKAFDASLKNSNTDLLEMSFHLSGCGECAKYQNRVFSKSGKDKRFPKLPRVVMELGGLHEGCRCSFKPFYYGITRFTAYNRDTKEYEDVDAIEYSNRPFVDDRTQEDKDAYKRYLEKLKKEDNWWENWKAKEIERGKERRKYELVVQELSDIAPKSFSGYMRMKNSKSKNWVKLVEAAKDKGINIESE